MGGAGPDQTSGTSAIKQTVNNITLAGRGAGAPVPRTLSDFPGTVLALKSSSIPSD